jgi:glycosyltransferase involved in cell wall biosynthesis
MRILQVNSSGTWGGGETHVQQLTEILKRRGHEVVVAGRRGSPLKPEIELPFLNSADFTTAIRLRRRIRESGFDIVHAHIARDYSVVAAALWALPKPQLVFTRHLLNPIRSHVFYRRVDGWIAPTAQIMNALNGLRRKVGALGAVVPNWVDVRKFAYLPHPLHTPITIGLLGQISPHKGHDDAIDATRQLGSNFQLLIAGEGYRPYVDRLKKNAAGFPIEFLGFISPSEFFRQIDILIVPSWEEPFGIVLLEAMASGIPVIATNMGGPSEIISRPAEGVLVPPRDPHALKSAIESLASNNEQRKAIICNARERVETHFDIQTVIPKIESVYRQVVKN